MSANRIIGQGYEGEFEDYAKGAFLSVFNELIF